jgi:TIR domain
MATQDRPLIYIGYSRKDQEWLQYVQSYLEPAAEKAGVEVWIDILTPGGVDWLAALNERLQRCDAYVLLVSPDAMASEHVTREIEIIRKREQDGENVRLFPILMTETPEVTRVRIRNKRWRPDRPLSNLRPLSATEQWTRLPPKSLPSSPDGTRL